MTKLNGYRLSTAIFALLFAAMVVQDLSRPEAGMPAGALPTHEPARHEVAPTSSEHGVDPPVTDGTGTPPETPDAAAAKGPALDLAMVALSYGGSAWKGMLNRVRPRGEEIIPIFEDWLRRREEMGGEDVDLRYVPRAYADLAGVRALPLLEELLSDPGWAGIVNEALASIDDPAAIALIRRHQDSLPENRSDVNITRLWYGTPLARDLVKDWARCPPANAPRVGKGCRTYVFSTGTEEEREEIWSIMDDVERITLIHGSTARSWGGPWPDRFVEVTTAGLRSGDPSLRLQALHNVLNDMDGVSAELRNEAERVVAAEVASEDGAGTGGPPRRFFTKHAGRFESWRQQKAAEKRKRELLKPR